MGLMDVIDIVILFMLTMSIFYSWKLNKKINELKEGKSEFVKIIKYFDDAILKAEDSITELKKLSSRANQELKQRSEVAKNIYDDLNFITDRASKLADDLESMMSKLRTYETSMDKQLNNLREQNSKKANTTNTNSNNRNFDDFSDLPYNARPKSEVQTNSQQKFDTIENLLKKISAIRSKQGA